MIAQEFAEFLRTAFWKWEDFYPIVKVSPLSDVPSDNSDHKNEKNEKRKKGGSQLKPPAEMVACQIKHWNQIWISSQRQQQQQWFNDECPYSFLVRSKKKF